MVISRLPFARLALAGAISLLAACGGDDAPAAAPTTTGTLLDSAVAGVHYTTSSGLSGVTDSDGHFQYKVGDTVTFSIGALTLGSITASAANATVTPLQIIEAATSLSDPVAQNKVNNVLVLLQSLDSDGNASNGITITEAAATALTSGVAAALDLAAAPATFAASAGLTDLASAAGTTPVDAATALAHFKAQFMAHLAGTYQFSLNGGLMTLEVKADGTYMLSQSGGTLAGGAYSGFEGGTLGWNPLTGDITPTVDPALDTNGTAGLSDMPMGKHVTFALNGDDLYMRTWYDNTYAGGSGGGSGGGGSGSGASSNYLLTRITDGPNILGAWMQPTNELPADTLITAKRRFYFLPSGAYVMVDPIGDLSASDCGGPGIERGQYSVSAGVITISNVTEDTNGCAGLHVNAPDQADHGTYTSLQIVSNTGTVLTLSAGDGTLTLQRVPY